MNAAATFPANLMLVAAMNPCPCGHRGDPKKPCRCTQIQIQRYFGRISGPVLDRIDLHVEVPHVPYEQLAAERDGAESSSVRTQVMAAREVQQRRFSGTHTYCNAAMTERQVQDFCVPDSDGAALLRNAVDSLGYSARAYGRILKVARTIADLEGAKDMGVAHVSEALQYRTLDREKMLAF